METTENSGKKTTESNKAILGIVTAQTLLISKMESLLKPRGLTLLQFHVMKMMSSEGRSWLDIPWIRERLLERGPDLTRLLDRLIERGWLEKNHDEKDKRKVLVRLTDAGLEKVKDLTPEGDKFDLLMSALSEQEQRELNELLDKTRG